MMVMNSMLEKSQVLVFVKYRGTVARLHPNRLAL